MSAFSKKQPIITVKEARKLLGSRYDSVPDQIIKRIITELEIFAELSLEVIAQQGVKLNSE